MPMLKRIGTLVWRRRDALDDAWPSTAPLPHGENRGSQLPHPLVPNVAEVSIEMQKNR